MKKIIFILLIACVMCAGAFAQDSIFVSAKGDNANSGLSETEPVKTLAKALEVSTARNINKITVIGTLDINSEGTGNAGAGFVFGVRDIPREILITGKPNASRNERAVLSGRNSNRWTVMVHNSKVRFEHIEISRGEIGTNELLFHVRYYGCGVNVFNNAQAAFGQGASAQNNARFGIALTGEGAKCIIDGGEVKNNGMGGVIIIDGALTLQDGAIKDNKTTVNGGVVVNKGQTFTMTGGSITGNRARSPGAGVFVETGGTFNQTGGTIRSNTSEGSTNHNVYREEGSLGSNL